MFKNMSIGKRIGIGFLVALVLLATAVMGERLEQLTKTSHEVTAGIQQVGKASETAALNAPADTRNCWDVKNCGRIPRVASSLPHSSSWKPTLLFCYTKPRPPQYPPHGGRPPP